jgi:hypothetical protein
MVDTAIPVFIFALPALGIFTLAASGIVCAIDKLEYLREQQVITKRL